MGEIPGVESAAQGAAVRDLLADESGQAMVEYGAIAGALLVSLIIAIRLVQAALSTTLRNHHYGLSNAP